jgi:hypothetical protein
MEIPLSDELKNKIKMLTQNLNLTVCPCPNQPAEKLTAPGSKV